ncbi:MAG: hypothetical protein JNG88_16615 [Phycisphaerales bacterium]|nr:hypothetical protein [Phycisphaerales bacterium]
MLIRMAIALGVIFPRWASADVVLYEANQFPEQAGWTIEQIGCDPTLWVADGCFHAVVNVCPGSNPPDGDSAAYRRSLADFANVPTFFVEWRVETNAPRTEIPWGGGAMFDLGSFYGVNYGFNISSNQAKLNRDNRLPIIFVDIEPGVPHTYRLELYSDDLYVWLIDGVTVDSGAPEGAFPLQSTDSIIWVTRSRWFPNTTRWDYIRYGTIGPEHELDWDTAAPLIRGDTNCDGLVNSFDIDPFVLALFDVAEYAVRYQDCDINRADVNGDGHVNNFDIDPFLECIFAGACTQ